MALNWDCSPAKSCYDLGWARYTMDGQTTKAQDNEVIGMTRGSTPPRKVRLAWQQSPGKDRNRSNSPKEGLSAQDICSYPAEALGPPFAPPRYRIIVAYAVGRRPRDAAVTRTFVLRSERRMYFETECANKVKLRRVELLIKLHLRARLRGVTYRVESSRYN